tara:strand:- start:146 stop:436 length:291 start_codon:yes stop_codon:yes gene_type:complete
MKNKKSNDLIYHFASCDFSFLKNHEIKPEVMELKKQYESDITEYEKSQLRKLVQDKLDELDQMYIDYYNDDEEHYSPSIRIKSIIREYKIIQHKLK